MKIRVALTVEVDPEAWSAAFGTVPADVRDDVSSHILSLINDDTHGLLTIVKAGR